MARLHVLSWLLDTVVCVQMRVPKIVDLLSERLGGFVQKQRAELEAPPKPPASSRTGTPEEGSDPDPAKPPAAVEDVNRQA